ncbi:hypothetical protein K7X08_032034 [Anisodus acutangulus]|uniref:Uncharacterized protein n=1 Tax=Anisodus acutangulus TaxID=402998 RepID=A0A9Q1RM94_9SOLA|nr:hypothetical protein K7X08_032034 [Anisodus acutangulus]
MILKLVPRVMELQSQLQEWTEWANQKVMQAARRLSKDKAELKTLLLEKEEASGQIERVNAVVHRLEVENAAIRREMEAAKLRATESSSSCQEQMEQAKVVQNQLEILVKEQGICT